MKETTESQHLNNRLLSEFLVPTDEAWQTAVVESLRGKPFESLISHAAEGINLPPMLRREDTGGIAHQYTLPGQPPYVRGISAAGYLTQPWFIAQELNYPTPKTFNEAFVDALAHGQTAVTIILDQPTRHGYDPDQAQPGEVGRAGLSLATADDFKLALQNTAITNIPVILHPGTSSLPLLALFIAGIQKEGWQTADLQGCTAIDPLAESALSRTLPHSLEHAYDEMALITAWAASHAPLLVTLTVNSACFHERGGSAVEELAFGMATGVAFLRAMLTRGIAIETAARHLRFQFAIGSQFFTEIAKLRAARLLWSQIVAAFGGGEEAQQMRIDGRTAQRDKATADPYTNILRGTNEALAAALGGVDTLHVAPFDEPLRQHDNLSRRIARNTQIILQEESRLTRLIDPAGGSYAVEYLTDQLARRAWELFQEVEGMGGMAAALQAGFPQARMNKLAEQLDAKIDSGEMVLVGINRYANEEEETLTADTPNYESIYKERVAQLAAYRANNDTAAREEALAKLSQAEQGDVVEAAIAAAAAGVTLNDLTRALPTRNERMQTVIPPIN
jgi:methylmalonyl-CoA mutase